MRPILSTSPTYATGENNYDTLFTPLKIYWYWTDPSITVVEANLGLYTIANDVLDAASSISQVSGVTFSCSLATKSCESTPISSAVPSNQGINYYISTGRGATADKNKV